MANSESSIDVIVADLGASLINASSPKDYPNFKTFIILNHSNLSSLYNKLSFIIYSFYKSI